MKKSFACMALIGMIAASCSKDEYFGPVYLNDQDTTITLDSLRLLVGCEGNFQYSNASLTVHDLTSGETSNNAFKKINNQHLGDVMQSIHIHGDSIYLVVNNSGIVRILDRHTLKQINLIEGLTSPRYVEVLDGNRLVVTDLYNNAVLIYDLTTLELMRTIPLEGWTERMLPLEDHLLIANIEDRSISTFLKKEMIMQQTTPLQFIPQFMLKAPGQQLVIAGNRSDAINKAVIKTVDETTLTPQDSLVLDEALVAATVHENELFVLTGKSVYTYDATSLQELDKWSHSVQTAYGMCLDPESGDLFLADARDYLSNGVVIRYSSTGTKRSSFEAGLIPQAMAIVR